MTVGDDETGVKLTFTCFSCGKVVAEDTLVGVDAQGGLAIQETTSEWGDLMLAHVRGAYHRANRKDYDR